MVGSLVALMVDIPLSTSTDISQISNSAGKLQLLLLCCCACSMWGVSVPLPPAGVVGSSCQHISSDVLDLCLEVNHQVL